MEFFDKNQTWTLVNLSKDSKPIGLQMGLSQEEQ